MFDSFLNALKQKTADLAKKTGGKLNSHRVKAYRGVPDACETSIEYSGFILSFVYHVGRGQGPKSVLSCMIHRRDAVIDLSFSVYDILSTVDPDDFECYTYSFLPDDGALCEAFDHLSEMLLRHFDKLCELFASGDKEDALFQSKLADVNEFFGRDIFKDAEKFEGDARFRYLRHAFEMYHSSFLMRFASGGYLAFLEGDYKKAIKAYSRVRGLSAYEKRLVEYMKGCDTAKKSASPTHLSKGLRMQSGKSVFLPMLCGWLLLTLVTVPVFLGLYYLFSVLLSNGALYSTSWAPYNAVYTVLPAFITSMSLSYFCSNRILRIFAGKKRDEHIRYGKIINTGLQRSRMKYFAYTVVFLGIMFTMLMANFGLRFYDNRLLMNMSISDIRPTEYTYSDITAVYRYDGIATDVGVTVDSPGTVIEFADGNMYDISGAVDNADAEKHIYPILEKEGIKIIKVRTPDEIKKD